MDKKHAATIKVLAELGLLEPQPLSEEQAQLFEIATDEDLQFLEAVKQIFDDNSSPGEQ